MRFTSGSPGALPALSVGPMTATLRGGKIGFLRFAAREGIQQKPAYLANNVKSESKGDELALYDERI
jgi:hypothetical protein